MRKGHLYPNELYDLVILANYYKKEGNEKLYNYYQDKADEMMHKAKQDYQDRLMANLKKKPNENA